jgi:large subunit ribosomal protein L32
MVVRRGKHTKTKQRSRRAHLKLETPKLVKCSHCGVLGLPHQICLNCGYYAGRKVIDVLAKLEKKERKKKQKELKSAEEETKQEKELNLQELSKK